MAKIEPISVRVVIDEKKVKEKVTNDRFGKFVALEWKRLIDPYTPRDTGMLEESARVRPWEIHYIQPYAEKVYWGSMMHFRKKNPYATYEWDKAAAEAGQTSKLARTINAALKSGKY